MLANLTTCLSGAVTAALVYRIAAHRKGGRRSKSTETGVEASTRLIIYIDVNKTLTISDPAGGKDVRDMINAVLAETVWGRVPREASATQGREWTCISTEPSATPPPNADTEGGRFDVMTFGEFLEVVKFPLLRPRHPGEEADCYWKNKELKETVKRLKVTFSSKGGVGERFKPYFEKLDSELQLRSHWKAGEEFRKGSVAENVQVPATMEHLFPKGRVFILPSFFHMLLKLQRRKQRFVLIFRTFGVDWSEIQQEMELFCTGEHPFYPFARFDGSSGTVDLRLRERECGTFFRCGTEDKDNHFILGRTLEQPKSSAEGIEWYKKKFPKLQILSGLEAIFNYFHYWEAEKTFPTAKNRNSNKPAGSAIFTRDYYPFWREQQEGDSAGKLMLVTKKREGDEKQEQVVSVFFDDNVERDRAHIADVRCMTENPSSRTFQPVPFRESLGHYLVKAEPLLAIQDHRFFIDKLDACVEAQKGKPKKT